MNTKKINLAFAQTALEEYRPQLDRFAKLLITENQKYNLTRIDSPQQIESRHFLDSLAGLSILDELSKEKGGPLKILDIGSGAGFPGLVLAIVRPQWHITSLEATAKKSNFQQIACDSLKLKNTTILNGRAEAVAHYAQFRQTFDVVTARALAAMPMLAELSLGFIKIGGLGLYWKGPSADEEILTAQVAIERMGAKAEGIYSYILQAENTEPANLSLIVCNKIKATPKEYPRVFGIIKKKSLS